MRELYINEKLIELSDNTPIGITFCANNIGELQNRNSSFSNTIKIPLTQNNKKALDWSHLVNSSTDLPYVKLRATYIENGIELVSNGSAIINSVDENSFSVNIMSGNSDLNELLGDTTVGELYSDSLITWNKSNILASNDKSKPYIHPIIDWRSDSDSFFAVDNIVDVWYLLPALRISDVFAKIEDYINFSFIGSYTSTNDHLNMVITPDYFEKENPTITKATNKNYGLWSDKMDLPLGAGFVTKDFPIKVDTFDSGFANDNVNGYTYYTPSATHFGKLKMSSTVVLKWFTSSYSWTQIKQTQNIKIDAYIEDDLGRKYAVEYNVLNEDTKLNYDKEFVLDISTPEIPFEVGVKYFVYLTVTAYRHNNKASIISMGSKVNTNDIFSHEVSKNIALGESIKYSDIFRMKVKDVLKDILNLRGLIIQTNSYLRTIQINNFDDLIKNKAIAKDWSDKVHSINGLKYTFGQYSQKNNLKFKEHSSVTKGYGDTSFSISNQNLDVEKDAVRIGHPATEQKTKYLGYNIPKIHGLNIDNEWQKPEYRLLTLTSKNVSVSYRDNSTTTNSSTNIPFCKFDKLSDLVPVHYKQLTSILNNTKVINAVIKMNGKDVKELDFSIPVYLDVPEFSISNYFYINRIEQYKKGLTNVELVRL